MGVKFDTFTGESFFAVGANSFVPTPNFSPSSSEGVKNSENLTQLLIKELKDKRMAEESEGAVIVPLDEFNLPAALIQKSDGTSLYLTRDIASLRYRIKEFKPEKVLYVVGNEQSFHFQQLFSIAKLMALNGFELQHVKFGLVLGEDKKKLSSREGKAVPMIELIDKAIEISRKTVEEKNRELSGEEKDDIAKAVGIGALKYFILKEHRSSDIIFDWDKILDLKGDSGPYLQYTFARLAGIKRKAGKIGQADFAILEKDIELSLVKKIVKFPEAVAGASQNNLSNVLTLYLYELANLANKFYESATVIQEKDETVRNARLALVDLTGRVLEKGLGLLGIKSLEKI